MRFESCKRLVSNGSTRTIMTTSKEGGVPYKDPERARARRREYYRENRQKWMTAEGNWKKATPRDRLRQRLMREYGIPLDRYEAMLLAQGGTCAVCRRPEGDARRRNLAVDHDHACCPGTRSCGKCIRGLLCSRCNLVAGLMEDDAKRLMAMVTYLSAPTGEKSK